MTELTQQIVELSQQQAIYLNCSLLLLIFGLVCCLLGINLLTVSCCTHETIIGVILLVLFLGCAIAASILGIKAAMLKPQIEMLKYQLDNVIPILPMK